MKRIVILTGAELRHTFFRLFLAQSEGIEVVRSYCEGTQKSLASQVEETGENDARRSHVALRQQSEEDFFSLYVENTRDDSRPVFLPKGEVNAPHHGQEIIDSQPDLLVAYGCSLIRDPLLSSFRGRFLNVHLGLSPYYRGVGTNFWPLVNREPEFVGATFMHLDAGVDTGEVIHQMRPRIFAGDSPSSIGNRLIRDMARVYRDIVLRFDELKRMPQLPPPAQARVYRRRDFSADAVGTLYANFRGELISQYLGEEAERCTRAPIVENPTIGSSSR